MSYTSGTSSAASRSPYGQSQLPMDQGARSTAISNSTARPSIPLPSVPQPIKPSLPAYSAPVESMLPPPYQEPERPYNPASLQQSQHFQAPSQPQPQAQTNSRVEWLPSQPQPSSQQMSLMAHRELQIRMNIEKEETVKFLMKVLSGGKSKATEIVERIPVTDPSKLKNLREVLKLFEWDKKGKIMLPFSWNGKHIRKLEDARGIKAIPDVTVTKDQRLSVRALIFYMISEVDVNVIKSNQDRITTPCDVLGHFIFNISIAMRQFKECDLEESTSEKILNPVPPWEPGEYQDYYYFKKNIRDGFRLKLFPMLNEAYKPIFNAVRGKSD